MKKQSFFCGVFVLLACGIIAKMLGAIYKIPLTAILGAEGLGIYQLVFPVFSFALTLSSSAMPTAISQIVSSRKSDFFEARQILKLSLLFLLVVGTTFCGLIFAFSSQIATFQGNPLASNAFKAIAPAILFASLLSAFRGYFQGKLNMTPTALSHIFEQFFKLFLGLLFGSLFLRFGVCYAPVGALLGVSLSEFFALTFLWLVFLKEKTEKKPQKPPEKNSKLFKILLKTFCLVGLCNVILPLSVFVDSFLVLGLLQKSGLDIQTATSLWGIESGLVTSIINLPVILGVAISGALVPNLAGQKKDRQKHIYQSFCLTIFVVLPLFVLLLFLAPEISQILFSANLSQNELKTLAMLLTFSAGITILFSILQTQNAVLQGLGKFVFPLVFMFFAFCLKTLVFVFLVQNSKFGIFGVTISKYVFFGVATLCNFVYFKKLGLKTFLPKKLAPTVFACFFMGLCLLVLGQFCLCLSVFWTFALKILASGVVFFCAFLCFSPQKLCQKLWLELKKSAQKLSKSLKIRKK